MSDKCRVLVVDDNRDAALTLTVLLKILGCETQTAYDGMEAVEMDSSFRPEIVLLDIGLPSLNGYEVARRIRQQEHSVDVFLVALTGRDQDEDLQNAKEAGFDRHITKPADVEVLKQLIEEANVRRQH